MADKEKLASVENCLVQRYNERGFLLEDDIIDCCVDQDLDLAEIDAVCDRLLRRNIIFRDSDSNKINEDDDEDEVYDRSHLDYDVILDRIKAEYPNCDALIEEVRSILPPQHREWRALVREAQSGNSFAKDRLIRMYLRTVLKQAYDFSKAYNCDFEDCFQNAVIGLIMAVERFDTTSPESFVSYFSLWARQVMNRDCFINGTLFRFPIHYKEQFLPVINGLNDTEIGSDSVATSDMKIIEKYEEYGNYRGINNELKLQFSLRYRDAYEEISGKKFDYNHIVPYLPIFDDFDYEDDFIERTIRVEINHALRGIVDSCLRDRERDVIIRRYGLDDGEARTLEEVGDALGVTRERIRQIESKALEKLKIRCKYLI